MDELCITESHTNAIISHDPFQSRDNKTFENGRRIEWDDSTSFGAILCFWLEDPETNTLGSFSIYRDEESVFETTLTTRFHREGQYKDPLFIQEIKSKVFYDTYPWLDSVRMWDSLSISDGGWGYKNPGEAFMSHSWCDPGPTNKEAPKEFRGQPVNAAFEIASEFMRKSVINMLNNGIFPNFSELNEPFDVSYVAAEELLQHQPENGPFGVVLEL